MTGRSERDGGQTETEEPLPMDGAPAADGPGGTGRRAEPGQPGQSGAPGEPAQARTRQPAASAGQARLRNREALLARLERYYDAVPRSAARAEPIGPLVLFVRSGAGWPYYARARLDGPGVITESDVLAVRERQRELGIPEAFEWVDEMTPTLRSAAVAAGLHVHLHPLLVLEREQYTPAGPPPAIEVRRITADAEDLAAVQGVPAVAFDHAGTDRGKAGEGERDLAALGQRAHALDVLRGRLRAGHTVMYAAYGPGGPVAVGSHQPVDGTTEIVGVGTLPAHRRAGLGAAITSALVEDALRSGVSLVFLSADSDAVARVYQRVGFRPAATAGIAEPPIA